MIRNQQMKSINDKEIKFEFEWTDSDGEINVYLQKFQEDKLERLGTIIQVGGLAYADKVYKMDKKGLYRIVTFPVIKGKEDRELSIETEYICVGGKNNLVYSFEEAEELNCSCIIIKSIDRPISKDLVYLKSLADGTKIPITADLIKGQKLYISNFMDFNLEIKYPYNLEVEKKRV